LPEEHLHPNRVWSLIRDGAPLAPHETEHLQHCTQCSEWLSVFTNLAQNAGSTPEMEAPFTVEVDKHFAPERGLALIRDRGKLTPAEYGHLLHCRICNTWICGLVAMARKAGFSITLEIPPCDMPEE
jgi:uncharacterized protein YuzB (UPF0349 family)